MDSTENIPQILRSFGPLLAYPAEDYAERADACLEALQGCPPEARALLSAFSAFARGARPEELEELYTRTFDLNPVYSLETGWHLYGEAYKRGAFMAEVRSSLKRHGVAENGELPDHLTHVLPLLAAMAEPEAGDFARTRVTPAVARMLRGFTDEDNPFRGVMDGLYRTLVAGYGEPEEDPAALGQAQMPEEVSWDTEGGRP